MSTNIIGELANASKALTAHRFGVTTAGNNMANVNNPDYARQRVVIGEDGYVQTVGGPRGLGVQVQGFEHMRDAVLDREILRETSLNASLTSQQSALAKAESSLGQEITRAGDSPFIDGATANGGGSGGIAETLNNFFNAFHSLSANPGSDAEKESLIQKADILTEKLNVTAERFGDLHDDIGLQVTTDLGQANQMIEEIARLNSEIARAESGGAGQALSLRDQRQGVLEDLSEIMQVRVEEIPESAGQIRVYVPTIGGDAPQLDLVERGRFQKVDFIDTTGPNPNYQFVVGDDQIRIDVKSGSIEGALTARDGAIAEYRRGLDGFAKELVTAVNAIYNQGASTAAIAAANISGELGVPISASVIQAGIAADNSGATPAEIAAAMIDAQATTNGVVVPSVEEIETSVSGRLDFFDPSTTTATTIRLASGLNSSTLRTTGELDQNKGDNSLALAIAELDDDRLAGLGNRDFASYYRSVVTNLGENVAKVDARLEDETIVFDMLKQQQESVSGVSLDEEMTDMMKYQRAFEATGKLIRAIDEMLDVIVNRLV
ncbi:flagellar hook-associated protein FlgK [Pelagicoccus sp. SDUM812002]|uniref:flagellar hook-associated protein FlgK n=1 Tax=Pelagicoccus sp. SDUM812002 TaxID=3041266 RepID=UPI00280CEFF8|nr:flagellar hook-associated protein FlgK [Pelagicoccus sp. SDUM812002]MDQ8185970.1 flagellar hook-associated protein FlgK [Pelagicoccus sp. SDUM812002]